MTRICSVCENEDRAGGDFCAYCGERMVDALTCDECGSTTETDGAFCPKCGAEYLDGSRSSASVDTEAQADAITEILEAQEVPKKIWDLTDGVVEHLQDDERVVLAAKSDVGKAGQSSTMRGGLLTITDRSVIYIPRSRKPKLTYRIPFEEIGSVKKRGVVNSFLRLWLPSTSIGGKLKSIVAIEFMYLDPVSRAQEMEQYVKSQFESGTFPPATDKVAKERAKPRGFTESFTHSGLSSTLKQIKILRAETEPEKIGYCDWEWAERFNRVLSGAKREFPDDEVLSELGQAQVVGEDSSDLDFDTAIPILEHLEAIYSDALSRVTPG